MPKSLPMLDPNEAPALGDLLYTVKDTGLPDRDRKLTLLQLLQAYLSGAFEDLGTLSWDKDQPITNVPAWRSQFPSGDLEQGWLNLREVLDPVSSVGLSWNITSENPVVALGSYTQSIRVAVSGNSASARTFTLTGTPRAGQEIWFFVGTANLTTPATIKHADDTLATVRGGELVRVYTLGTELVAQVVAGSQNLGRASDLTWLTGPLLEQWFTGLGWTDATHPGWTGDQLLTVLNAFGPTYQEAATSAAAARKLAEELSGSVSPLETIWSGKSSPPYTSDDTVFVGTPCRAVRVRGHVVDATSPTTDAALSLEVGTADALGGGAVILYLRTSVPTEPTDPWPNRPLWAFISALHAAGSPPSSAHVFRVPATFYGDAGSRQVTAHIRALTASPIAEVEIKFQYGTNPDVVTWEDVAFWYPSGKIALHLHATLTLPAAAP